MEDGFLAAVLIFAMLIVAAIIIIVLLSRQKAENDGLFGDSCSTDSDCRDGQCLKGKCSLPKGSICTQTLDCESGTTCVNGVCAITGITIGGTCGNSDICESPLVCNLGTCKSITGGPCSNNSQCVSGTCTDNVCTIVTGMSVIDLLTPMNAGPIIPVTDVAGNDDIMLTLQENGSIIMDDGRDAVTVFSSVKLNMISWSKSAIFGVAYGKLYSIKTGVRDLYWDWRSYKNSPDIITHICCTLDSKHLWVEVKLPKNRKRGYTYKIGSHGDIKLLGSAIVKGTKIYGRHIKEYAIMLGNRCMIYRNDRLEETINDVVGVGFDPDNGEIMTSDKEFRVVKALGVFQVP